MTVASVVITTNRSRSYRLELRREGDGMFRWYSRGVPGSQDYATMDDALEGLHRMVGAIFHAGKIEVST